MGFVRTAMAWAVCGMMAAAAFGRQVTIVVNDLSSGTGVEGINVEWESDETNSMQKGTTGPDGTLSIDVPEKNGKVQFMKAWLSKPGRVGLFAFWAPGKDAQEPPEKWVFLSEPGVKISGRVLDEQGQPVEGAHVIAEVTKKYPGNEQRVSIGREKHITGADGRWSFEGVPADCQTIAMTAWSVMHLPDQGYYLARPFEPRAKLYDGSAVIVMPAATRIEGIVRDPNGAPVSGASVYFDPERRVSNTFPPVKTDAAGKFVLGIQPGAAASFVAEHAGMAPAWAHVRVGSQSPQMVELTLGKPNVLAGRVIGKEGKGIDKATVWVHGWHDRDDLNKELTTDADGVFTWNEAPAGEVKADIYGKGYSSLTDVSLRPGEKNELKLVTPTTITITVVDAATGAPLPKFHVAWGAVWHSGEPMVWQSSDRVDTGGKRNGNVFTYQLDEPIAQCLLRVLVDGYYPEDTGLFAADGQPKAFTLKLQHGEPLQGHAAMADGSAPGTGAMYLASDYMSVSNGNYVQFEQVRAPFDKEGHFTVQPQRDKMLMVAVTDKGVGFWRVGEWEHQKEFTLQPWGKVDGRLRKGSKPVAMADVMATSHGDEFSSNAVPQVAWRYSITTGAEGEFALDHVWPGRLELERWVPNHVPGRMWNIYVGAVDVAPGKSYHVQLGGAGKPVVGRLDMPFAGKPWMIRIAEAKSTTDPHGRTFSPEIADDGAFRIDDMPAGSYAMRIALHEPPPENSCGWGRVLGEYTANFTVPEVPGRGLSEEPVELGLIPSAPVPTTTVKAGDIPPDFSIKTLTGTDVRLSAFKGKVVLLDFWATWCAPCMEELPHVKDLQTAYGKDADFVLIGMNEDENPKYVTATVERDGITWPQAMLGADSDIAKQYGATAIPATVLIGRDGRVIVRDLRGEALRKAVADALGKPASPPPTSP